MTEFVFARPRKYARTSFFRFIGAQERRLVLPWFGALGLGLSGRKLYDIYLSPELQLETALALDRRFQADFVNIMDDGIICSETLGARLIRPDYDFPSVLEPLLASPRDLASLRVPDPGRDGRMPLNLKALKMLAEASEKPVVVSVVGPFTLAGQLLGVQDLARHIIRDPAFVRDLLDFTAAAVGAYARAAVAAGADLVSLAEPTAVVLPPGRFEELALENLQKIFSTLDCWKALHICGNTSPLLYAMVQAGADALSLDQVMDLPALAPFVPETMVLFGNIAPIEVMVDLGPAEVRDRVLQLLRAAADFPNFILSTGCDLTRDTPLENMAAFMEAGRTPLAGLKKTGVRTRRPGPPLFDPDDPEREHEPACPGLPAEQDEILARLSEATLEFDVDAAARWCRRAVQAGIEAETIISRGLARGMKRAGDLFERRIYFLPEIILAADALAAGMEVVKPYLKPVESKTSGLLMLGVIEGDIHDIGKNLVATMFQASGWKTADLGVNVDLKRFLEGLESIRPDLLGMSTLISTTMRLMPEYIRKIKAAFPNLPIILGGAPLTARKAREFGADGYAPDAFQAVREGDRLLGKPRPR
ncbi:MAG: uroporphyrinogen decarboxylase family protein [Pseudomonadota bacterium]